MNNAQRWSALYFFLLSLLCSPLFAEGDGGGDGGGDGDSGGEYDGDQHHDGDGDVHHHHHHDRIFLGIGGFYDPWFWGGPGLYGYRGYGYFNPYYSNPPIARIPAFPPIYVQQRETIKAQPKTNYWYYCQNPEGYYPTIKECPGGWLQVAPQPNAQ